MSTKIRKTALGDVGVSRNAVARVLVANGSRGDASVDAVRQQLSRDLVTATTVPTPVGDLFSHFDIPLKKDGPYRCMFIKPAALLYHLTTTYELFRQFAFTWIHQWRSRGGGDDCIILYTDELNTGNPLRHDHSTKYQTVYWTCAWWPDWFRCRTQAWFVFTVIPLAIQNMIAGGLSCLLRCVLREFFDGAGGAGAGVALPTNSGEPIFVRMRLLCFLQDEKAHKEAFCVKGASGTKPCHKCKNVIRK
eukprot:5827962-Pyramimonas_sp.AAC.1